MTKWCFFALIVSFPCICHAQAVEAGSPQVPGTSPSASRELIADFEYWEGGSRETEARLIRSLAAKFAIIQASTGAQTGGNKRGTHANGFCLKGRLEIYDQTQENAWLQIGPFSSPLKCDDRPEVRIRFADANGKPAAQPPVPEADVRAISLSFEVEGKRQDFSMNNDPRFNFGTLTDFNNFLSYSILSAGSPNADPRDPNSPIGQLFSANPDVAKSVMSAKLLNDAQLKKVVYAYHTENYYTGSVFSFGTDSSGKSRAAKFRLVWCGENKEACRTENPEELKGPFLAERAKLIERTTRAINDEASNEFCFELEVQILDEDKVKGAPEWTTPAGTSGVRPRSVIDWVENATLEWNDEVATTYKLGKLTAIPGSITPDGECEHGAGFDVNKNNSGLFIPLGNINRARALVERQSEKLRTPNDPNQVFPKSTQFTHSTTIDQGWNADDRDIFWYLPQGAYIIPYDWFLALTDPATGKPLRDSLESFGFLHADDEASVSGRILNPDKLPIGMSRETPPGNAFPDLRGNGDWIGITCAACHVGAVTINETRFIIDGAPSALNFEKFSLAIEASLDALLKADAAEFTRFQNQLPSPAPDEARLRESVSQVLDRLASRNTRSFFHGLNRAYGSVNAGPGRTDAFGVILNEVAARALEGEGNAKTATAPVSFPQLWGAPDEEWVQYSGLSNNAFTRNVGQVLGVFGDVILDPKSNDFLATTARSSNLQVLEEKLRTLKAPNWEQVFSSFTAQEYKQIHRGEAVYSVTCARCHSENPQIVTMVPFAEFGQDGHRNRPSVGTDPLYFVNLARSWTNADTGLLKGNSVLGELERKDSEIASLFRKPYLSTRFDARYAPRGNMIEILSDATTGIALKYMKDNRILFDLHDQKFNYLTGGALPIRQTHIGAFKARSLRGIAFTGPYFHNGSVRTLREVLSPEERSTEFFLGGTGYDQANGGFENAGTFLFRANKMGNLNIGHDFAAQLSPAEKEDLLMYLKSL